MEDQPKSILKDPRAACSRLFKITLVLFPVSYVVFALLVSDWFPFATDEESVRHILEWLVILTAGISITFLLSLLPLNGAQGFGILFTLFLGISFVVVFGIGRNSSIPHPIGKLIFFSLLYATGWALLGILAVAFCRWVFHARNFKRFIFGVVCFATLIALFYAEEDWRGKHDWEKFKRTWEAKGEHFDFASIVPPPVPDDQNFAMTPIWVNSIEFEFGTNVAKQWYGENLTEPERVKLPDPLHLTIENGDDWRNWPTNGNWAKGTETDLTNWQRYYRVLASKTNLFPVPSQPQSPAADVLFALDKYDPVIEALRQASSLPYSRFPVFSDADRPFNTLLPHLSVFKRCAQFLQLRALAELQNGQSGKAADDVKLALQLMDKFRNEPFLISHLVRIAMVQITLQPIYEGLAEHKWSDAQLTELDAELAKLDFLADYEFSMRGERICFISALEYMRRSQKIDMPDFNGGASKITMAWFIPSAFFYQNELTVARIHQQCILPLVDAEHQLVLSSQVRSLVSKEQRELAHHVWPYKVLAKMLLPAFNAAAKKFACGQSSVNLARTAIALERCRLAHGEFPDSLDALAPQFIAKVPHDVIGGQPLKYRRTSDGQFVLYSVGWNETDDGGVVVLGKGKSPTMDVSQGDWVWRYPQK